MTTIRLPSRRRKSSSWRRTFLVTALLLSQVFLVFLFWPKSKQKNQNLRQQQQHHHGLEEMLRRSRERRGAAADSAALLKMKKMKWEEGDEKEEAEVEEEGTEEESEQESSTEGEEKTENKEDSTESQEKNEDEENEEGGDNEEEETDEESKKEDEEESNETEANDEKEGDEDEGKAPDLPDESPETDGGVQGNHVTSKSFVAEYQYTREHPAFRDLEPQQSNAKHVASLVHHESGQLTPCQTYNDQGIPIINPACMEEGRTLFAYNTHDFERVICDGKKTVAPNSAVELDDCPLNSPSRLLPTDEPPVDGSNMPPIVIQQHKDNTTLKTVQCDIPCQEEENMTGDTRYIQGTDWTIITSMDDPFETTTARVERTAYRSDKYYSTTSFKSSVPLSYFSFDNYDIAKVSAMDFDELEPSASYLIDDKCKAQGSKRNRWVGAVAANFPVAHYGSCDHDTDLPDGLSLKNRKDRIKIHQKHLFNLAFETSNEKDHITEVIWDAFQSGSVPVILGPSNLKNHLPPHSYINCGDFQQWDQLGKYVASVAANRTLWESYHDWRRDKDVVQAFKERYEFTLTDPSCRMCRWAYAKKYGLGWNHEKQIVRENAIPRKTCVDAGTGLTHKPFVESWTTLIDDEYGDVKSASQSDSCEGEHSPVVDAGEFSVSRTVVSHDSVVDISVASVERRQAKGNIILRMEFPVKNREAASFPNSHTLVKTASGSRCTSVTIQDYQGRVTLIANWDTTVESTEEGVVEVTILESEETDLEEFEQRRIRIIVEDVNTLSDKVTEFYPSSFGQMMTKDFIDPMELYFDDSR